MELYMTNWQFPGTTDFGKWDSKHQSVSRNQIFHQMDNAFLLYLKAAVNDSYLLESLPSYQQPHLQSLQCSVLLNRLNPQQFSGYREAW